MSSESDTISKVLECIIYYCIPDQAHCEGQLKYCYVISHYSFIHLAATYSYLTDRSPVFAFKIPGCFEPWYSRELLLLLLLLMKVRLIMNFVAAL